MIAKLKGLVDAKAQGSAVIDVQGVGYLVLISARTLDRLPAEGQPAELLVETEVREDAITLYGFADTSERAWFRLLRSVQGVGAKVALSILSALTPDQVSNAVVAADAKMLARADGVGPKLAQRIANELKDKAAAFALPAGARKASATAAGGAAEPVAAGAIGDAVSALVNLGYGRADALTAVTEIAAEIGADAPLDRLIPQALQRLSL